MDSRWKNRSRTLKGICGLAVLLFGFICAETQAADKPSKAPRGPASAEKRDTARVAQPALPADYFPSVVTFSELMAAPVQQRMVYLKRMREMMVELEKATNRSGKTADTQEYLEEYDRRKTALIELEFLMKLFFAEARAEACPSKGVCADGQIVDLNPGYGPNNCVYVCADKQERGKPCNGDVVNGLWRGSYYESGWQCIPKGSPRNSDGVPDLPAKNESSNANWGSGNNLYEGEAAKNAEANRPPEGYERCKNDPRAWCPKGRAAAGSGAGQTPIVEGADGRPVRPQGPPTKFDEKAYSIGNSEVAKKGADGGYEYLKNAEKLCNVTLLDKAQCAKLDKDQSDVCYIGGVKSKYGSNGFCEPASCVCYDEQGNQLLNDKCKASGVKRKSCCSHGTVCEPDLGRRNPEDKVGGDKDQSNGAFCAPVGGSGAKSATAVCGESVDTYNKSLRNANDFLSEGDSASAEKRWEKFRKRLKEDCDGAALTKRNCEACQVMKLRLANARKEMTGSCTENDEEGKKVKEYWDQNQPAKTTK